MATRILIVDDEPLICQLLTYQLGDAGYEVISARNGWEALDRLLLDQPDLVLLDVMMPEMNGWDVCRQIRAYSDVPVIMLTAKGSDADVAAGLIAGADDYIAKPFDLAHLLRRVEAMLRRTRLTRPNGARLAAHALSDDNGRPDSTPRQAAPASRRPRVTRPLPHHPDQTFAESQEPRGLVPHRLERRSRLHEENGHSARPEHGGDRASATPRHSPKNHILDDRYELEQQIGAGGMARIYRGRDRWLNRYVAVKVFRPHDSADPNFLARFQREAQAVAKLSHPNAVEIYDIGYDGEIHYIVMEYIEGDNLKTLIGREGPLPPARAIAIAAAVAQGLQAAHRVGLVHHDVKPQNIMIGSDRRVRITDFGIARSYLSTTMTRMDTIPGTAEYISPEQAQGQPATPRSDIYALGVVLFEMLTGRLPFAGDSPIAVVMQHVSAEPPSPRQINPHVPPHLDALVLQALAKEPFQRPASAQEFEQLLHSQGMADQATVLNLHLVRRAAETQQPQPAMARDGATVPVRYARSLPALSGIARRQRLGRAAVLVVALVVGVLCLMLILGGGIGQLFASLNSLIAHLTHALP